MVELTMVKKVYNDKIVLDVGNLTFQKGRIYGVLGPNGSGKSTMLRIVAGFDRDFSGSICYNKDTAKYTNSIAYMPQNIYMFDKTVLQNVMLGLKKMEDEDTVKKIAKEALNYVGMNGFANAKARSLSGGEAQRVALARTLVLGKRLVLLDEPASATDIAGVELIERYIKTVNEKEDSTIIFTTHNPSQAARIADEVIIMHRGRVVEKGSPSEVFNSPAKQETRDFLRSWRI